MIHIAYQNLKNNISENKPDTKEYIHYNSISRVNLKIDKTNADFRS